jgi:hypothetical protein
LVTVLHKFGLNLFHVKDDDFLANQNGISSYVIIKY